MWKSRGSSGCRGAFLFEARMRTGGSSRAAVGMGPG
jgi:hypothetical protein